MSKGYRRWIWLGSVVSGSLCSMMQQGDQMQGVNAPVQGRGVTPQPSSAFAQPPVAPLAGAPLISTAEIGSQVQSLGTNVAPPSANGCGDQVLGPDQLVSPSQVSPDATLVVNPAALSDLLQNRPKLYAAMVGSGAVMRTNRAGETTPVLQNQLWTTLSQAASPQSQAQITVNLTAISLEMATYLVQELMAYPGGILAVIPPAKPSSMAPAGDSSKEGEDSGQIIGGHEAPVVIETGTTAAAAPLERVELTGTKALQETQPGSSTGSHQEGSAGGGREQQAQRSPGFLL